MRLAGTLAIGFVLADASAVQAHLHLHGALAKPFDAVGAITAAAHADTGEDAYVQGKRLLGLDDTMGALAAFRQALTRAPQSIDALNGVAICYDRLGRPDIARGFYEAGLAIAPDSPALLNNLGYSLYLQGNRDAAVGPLSSAAESVDPAIAASARRTLALIAAARTPSASVDVSEPAPPARIEVTSQGEQRLVLGTPARPPANLATLGDDAALASVAPAWTAADDRELIAGVRAEERAEVLALADTSAASPRPAAVAPTRPVFDIPDVPASWPAAQAPAEGALASITDVIVSGSRIADADAGSTATQAEGLAALARQSVPDPGRIKTLAGQRPRERQPGSAFESDDPHLNAFAARMRGNTPGITPALAALAAQVRAA